MLNGEDFQPLPALLTVRTRANRKRGQEERAEAGQGACREGQGRGSEEAKRNRPIKVKTFEV